MKETDKINGMMFQRILRIRREKRNIRIRKIHFKEKEGS